MIDQRIATGATTPGLQRPRSRGKRLRAAPASLALAGAMGGCGSGDVDPGSSSASAPEDRETETSASASPTSAATDVADPGVLDAQTPAGSIEQFAARDLCVNASDYVYVLTVLSGADPPAAEPSTAFAEASLGRMNSLAGALSQQVPPAQRDNAEGAVRTWTIGSEALRATGYDVDSAEAFLDAIAPRIRRYIPGNAALLQYLDATCSTRVADFATRLAPPN